jgi:hypothetical protein
VDGRLTRALTNVRTFKAKSGQAGAESCAG